MFSISIASVLYKLAHIKTHTYTHIHTQAYTHVHVHRYTCIGDMMSSEKIYT